MQRQKGVRLYIRNRARYNPETSENEMLFVDVADYARTYIWQVKETLKQQTAPSSPKLDELVHFSEVRGVQRLEDGRSVAHYNLPDGAILETCTNPFFAASMYILAHEASQKKELQPTNGRWQDAMKRSEQHKFVILSILFNSSKDDGDTQPEHFAALDDFIEYIRAHPKKGAEMSHFTTDALTRMFRQYVELDLLTEDPIASFVNRYAIELGFRGANARNNQFQPTDNYGPPRILGNYRVGREPVQHANIRNHNPSQVLGGGAGNRTANTRILGYGVDVNQVRNPQQHHPPAWGVMNGRQPAGGRYGRKAAAAAGAAAMERDLNFNILGTGPGGQNRGRPKNNRATGQYTNRRNKNSDTANQQGDEINQDNIQGIQRNIRGNHGNNQIAMRGRRPPKNRAGDDGAQDNERCQVPRNTSPTKGKAAAKKERRLCDNCEESEADFYCGDCDGGQALCHRCSDIIHRAAAKRGHQVKDVSEAPRKSKAYIPQPYRAPFAILLALYSGHVNQDGPVLLSMEEDELKSRAQNMTDTDLSDRSPGKRFNGFDGIEALITKDLIKREATQRPTYALTDSGLALSENLLEFHGATIQFFQRRGLPMWPYDTAENLVCGESRVCLLIDKYEKQRDRLVAMAEELEIPAQIRELKVCDYMWILTPPGQTGLHYDEEMPDLELVLPHIVERKTWDDLDDSLQTNRFNNQINKMKRSGLRDRFYLLEGSLNNMRNKNFIRREALKDRVEMLHVREGFHVVRTCSWLKTARWLQRMTHIVASLHRTGVNGALKSMADIKSLATGRQPPHDPSDFEVRVHETYIWTADEMVEHIFFDAHGVRPLLETAQELLQLPPEQTLPQKQQRLLLVVQDVEAYQKVRQRNLNQCLTAICSGGTEPQDVVEDKLGDQLTTLVHYDVFVYWKTMIEVHLGVLVVFTEGREETQHIQQTFLAARTSISGQRLLTDYVEVPAVEHKPCAQVAPQKKATGKKKTLTDEELARKLQAELNGEVYVAENESGTSEEEEDTMSKDEALARRLQHEMDGIPNIDPHQDSIQMTPNNQKPKSSSRTRSNKHSSPGNTPMKNPLSSGVPMAVVTSCSKQGNKGGGCTSQLGASHTSTQLLTDEELARKLQAEFDDVIPKQEPKEDEPIVLEDSMPQDETEEETDLDGTISKHQLTEDDPIVLEDSMPQDETEEETNSHMDSAHILVQAPDDSCSSDDDLPVLPTLPRHKSGKQMVATVLPDQQKPYPSQDEHRSHTVENEEELARRLQQEFDAETTSPKVIDLLKPSNTLPAAEKPEVIAHSPAKRISFPSDTEGKQEVAKRVGSKNDQSAGSVHNSPGNYIRATFVGLEDSSRIIPETLDIAGNDSQEEHQLVSLMSDNFSERSSESVFEDRRLAERLVDKSNSRLHDTINNICNAQVCTDSTQHEESCGKEVNVTEEILTANVSITESLRTVKNNCRSSGESVEPSEFSIASSTMACDQSLLSDEELARKLAQELNAEDNQSDDIGTDAAHLQTDAELARRIAAGLQDSEPISDIDDSQGGRADTLLTDEELAKQLARGEKCLMDDAAVDCLHKDEELAKRLTEEDTQSAGVVERTKEGTDHHILTDEELAKRLAQGLDDSDDSDAACVIEGTNEDESALLRKDEDFARQLAQQLQSTEHIDITVDEHLHKDEELARKLAEEPCEGETLSSSSTLEEDEALARKLAAEFSDVSAIKSSPKKTPKKSIKDEAQHQSSQLEEYRDLMRQRFSGGRTKQQARREVPSSVSALVTPSRQPPKDRERWDVFAAMPHYATPHRSNAPGTSRNIACVSPMRHGAAGGSHSSSKKEMSFLDQFGTSSGLGSKASQTAVVPPHRHTVATATVASAGMGERKLDAIMIEDDEEEDDEMDKTYVPEGKSNSNFETKPPEGMVLEQQVNVTCGACKNKGHSRTYKHCPMYYTVEEIQRRDNHAQTRKRKADQTKRDKAEALQQLELQRDELENAHKQNLDLVNNLIHHFGGKKKKDDGEPKRKRKR